MERSKIDCFDGKRFDECANAKFQKVEFWSKFHQNTNTRFWWKNL